MKKNSGQALVEYALILIFIAVAVIVILSAFGPAISNVFSGLVNRFSQDWTYCADEHANCSFTGTLTVRYGANDVYYFGTFTDGTPCTNEVFGDPLVGTFKYCYYR
jgi:Flp pilus assembly pilin Flp